MERSRPSLLLSATAMCAALYAIGSYSTAYIPSPWGVGQFRPAVVIPALFATVFGGLPAGVGAALGTFLADSLKHGYPYPGSYLAAVPGNFIGFYLFGFIVRRFSWTRFLTATHVTLTVANFIVAALYVLVFKLLYLGDPTYMAFSQPALATFIVGLTIWWYVTMLPFVLVVTPVLVRVVATAFPALVSEDVKIKGVRDELPHHAFAMALAVPGVAMLLLGLITSFTTFGEDITMYFGEMTVSLIQLMCYVSGVFLSLLAVMLKVTPVFRAPRQPTPISAT
jgi:hypothetical protein